VGVGVAITADEEGAMGKISGRIINLTYLLNY